MSRRQVMSSHLTNVSVLVIEMRSKTVNELLKYNSYFKYLDLCTPGKLPVSEEIFKKGGIFMRNEDINCIPMCKFIKKIFFKYNFKGL